MKDIVQRIIEIQHDSGMDKKSFAEKIGISAASLSHIHTGRNNPSLELILNVLKSNKNISSEWLLFGSGGKLRTDKIVEKEMPTTAPELRKANQKLRIDIANRLQVLKLLIEEHYKSELSFVSDLEERHYVEDSM